MGEDRTMHSYNDEYTRMVRDFERQAAASSPESPEKAVSTFLVDVTANIVVTGTVTNLDIFYPVPGVSVPGPLDVHSASWGSRIIAEKRTKFFEMIDRGNLLSMFRRGERQTSLEYWVYDLNGKKVYLNETVILKKSERNGDVLGLIVMRDFTAKKTSQMQEEHRLDIIEGLTREYEMVFAVEPENDTYEIYRMIPRVREGYGQWITSSYRETIERMALHAVSEKDREMFIREMSPAGMRANLKNVPQYSFTFRHNRGEKIIYYRASMVEIGGNGDEDSRVLFGFANIDEEKQDDKRRQEITENELRVAKEADMAKSIFLSNMSHDIRTPMNAIMGFTAIAQAQIDDKEKVSECLRKINISGTHLLRLINNVLDMSRIESGKFELDRHDCSLREIVDDVVDMIYMEAQAKKQVLDVHVDDDVPDAVYCDSLRVKQVIVNLLSNAVKFTPEGGLVHLGVHKREEPPQEAAKHPDTFLLRVSVRDNGIGMSEEFLKHAFEPFERENSSTVSRVSGSGLGLSICAGIMKHAGGTIRVKSKRGKGTEFQIFLRVQLQKNSSVAELRQEGTARIGIFTDRIHTPSTPSPGTVRILLVEDNEFNREIAVELLGDAGYAVDVAENGEGALQMLTQNSQDRYSAILMDIQMPVMNGMDATREIRKLPDRKLSQIPIIAMTANAFEEDMKLAKEAGMDAYIAKPVGSREISYVLERIL